MEGERRDGTKGKKIEVRPGHWAFKYGRSMKKGESMDKGSETTGRRKKEE